MNSWLESATNLSRIPRIHAEAGTKQIRTIYEFTIDRQTTCLPLKHNNAWEDLAREMEKEVKILTTFFLEHPYPDRETHEEEEWAGSC